MLPSRAAFKTPNQSQGLAVRVRKRRGRVLIEGLASREVRLNVVLIRISSEYLHRSENSDHAS